MQAGHAPHTKRPLRHVHSVVSIVTTSVQLRRRPHSLAPSTEHAAPCNTVALGHAPSMRRSSGASPGSTTSGASGDGPSSEGVSAMDASVPSGWPVVPSRPASGTLGPPSPPHAASDSPKITAEIAKVFSMCPRASQEECHFRKVADGPDAPRGPPRGPCTSLPSPCALFTAHGSSHRRPPASSYTFLQIIPPTASSFR